MAYVAPSSKSDGDTITSAIWNQDVVDNIKATLVGVVTNSGDIGVGTGAGAVSRLGIGSANEILAVNSLATSPEWVANAPAASAITGLTADTSLFVDSAAALASVALGASGTVYTSAGATADPTWSALPASGGAWTHIAGTTSEVTTTGASATLGITYSGLSIPLGTPYVIVGRCRAGTTSASFGKAMLHTTQASGDTNIGNAAQGDLMSINTWYASTGGFFHFGIMEGTGEAEYNPFGSPGSGGAWCFTMQWTNYAGSGAAGASTDYLVGNRAGPYTNTSNQIYNEEITGFKIYIASSNGSNTFGINDVHVYKLAVS